MSDESNVRAQARELDYKLIKVPGTDRYNLAENHWYGFTLDEIEKRLDKIQFGDGEEDTPVAVLPVLAETPATVASSGVDITKGDDLDAEIAAMTEKIRTLLWLRAAREWWCHYVEGESPPSIDLDSVDAVCPAFAYAWQKAIDLGCAAPVEEEWPYGKPDFPVPTLDWIGVGLDWPRDGVVWEDTWFFLDTFIPGVAEKTNKLERRWVEREIRNQLKLDEKIDDLFDEDGDWKSEGQRVSLCWNSNYIEAPKPTVFTDDLIYKVDRRGAPDYASGWWDDDEDPPIPGTSR